MINIIIKNYQNSFIHQVMCVILSVSDPEEDLSSKTEFLNLITMFDYVELGTVLIASM